MKLMFAIVALNGFAAWLNWGGPYAWVIWLNAGSVVLCAVGEAAVYFSERKQRSWRDEAIDRLNALSDLQPPAPGEGINREPADWWRTHR